MPFRPALRPGAPLLRRDAHHLQIGTSPGIVVVDRPGLLPLLRLIDGARDTERLRALTRTHVPELDDLDAVLTELLTLGIVFDASRWGSSTGGRPLAEARHADFIGDDPRPLDRRSRFGVAFHADGPCEPLAETCRAILVEAGIADVNAADPDLVVIASCGEPSRAIFEHPVARRLDHLIVVVDEDRVRLGPFVRPGRTPCLGCLDLHRADWDRAWSALLPQLGRHTAMMTPPALDAITRHAAALELASEVLTLVDGRGPRSAAHCLVIGPRHGERASWPVAFHHACACDLLSAA